MGLTRSLVAGGVVAHTDHDAVVEGANRVAVVEDLSKVRVGGPSTSAERALVRLRGTCGGAGIGSSR
jgi:hypothetical protein